LFACVLGFFTSDFFVFTTFVFPTFASSAGWHNCREITLTSSFVDSLEEAGAELEGWLVYDFESPPSSPNVAVPCFFILPAFLLMPALVGGELRFYIF